MDKNRLSDDLDHVADASTLTATKNSKNSSLPKASQTQSEL